MIRRKKDNNLILVSNGFYNRYFTSYNKAGMYLGIATASIKWAINHSNKLTTNDDEIVTIEWIDGSEIPYKYINN